MQMLYIFKSFPGSMQPLLRFISADKAHTAVFMAERWQRDTALPGVKRVHIPAPTPLDAPASENFSGQQITESKIIHYARRAEVAGGLYDRLRTMGFRPDLIYAAPDSGHALYVKDYFPSARLICRAEQYHRRENMRASSPPEAPSAPLAEADARLVHGEQASSSPPLSLLQRVHNASMVTAMEECDAAITSSAWQKSLFPRWLGKKIHIARSGVHTQLFRPALSESQEESIVIAFHGSTFDSSLASIGQSLPVLLASRPACRVRILFFARTRSERERKEHTAKIAALLPPPPPTKRNMLKSLSLQPRAAI